MKMLIKSSASKTIEIKKRIPESVTVHIQSVVALILAVFLGATIVALPFVTTPWRWLPQFSEARTLLATLLTAQAAIAALTLAVTLFVMQGISVRRDSDDRMYREYVRQSRVRCIFWSSILAVGITGLVFLTQAFFSGVETIEAIVPGLAACPKIARGVLPMGRDQAVAAVRAAAELVRPARLAMIRMISARRGCLTAPAAASARILRG